MRYSFDFTIPAATAVTAPYEGDIILDVGIIKQIEIRFKAGCHNRVSVAIFDSLEQVAPAKSTKAIYGDDHTFVIPMDYAIEQPPFSLIFKGWSPDTRYDHTISVWLDVLPIAEKKNKTIAENISYILKGGA